MGEIEVPTHPRKAIKIPRDEAKEDAPHSSLIDPHRASLSYTVIGIDEDS